MLVQTIYSYIVVLPFLNYNYTKDDSQMDIKTSMNTGYPCCLGITALNDVYLMLVNSSYDAVVVIDQKMFPIGIITLHDIEEMCSRSDSRDSNFVADDVFNCKDINICWEGDDVEIALSILSDKGISLLPVVNSDFCFVGVMTEYNSMPLINNALPIQVFF